MFVRLLLEIPAFFGIVLRFGLICAVMGVINFCICESMPRKNFDYRAFPYRTFSWEKGGMIYQKLRIQKWKDRVPDMSRYMPKTFRKKLTIMRSPDFLEGLIAETCVAEMVHWVLTLLSPIFLILMPRVWNWISMVLYVLVGNLPFIIIQRYNRPRLVMILERQLALERQKARAEG